jgi:hypothetical protein
MPGWLKVLLGLAAAGFCFFAVLVGGGAWYVARHKDEAIAGAKEAVAAGQAFGDEHGARDCIDEGLRRLAKVDGLAHEVQNNVWTSSCLGAASSSQGFCDGVPNRADLIKGFTWRREQCDAHPDVDSQRCDRVLGVWQGACENAGAAIGRQRGE